MMKTKKKSGKRFLSWLLAAVMIIALMPANAFANDDNDYGGIDTYANQSNDNVEFWCTNSRVNVGGKTSASLDSLLSGKKQLVFAQESSLQEGTLTNGLTGKLWKVMVQDNRNKQTENSNDNKTDTGTEITSIWREWKWTFLGYQYQYNYLTAAGQTGTLTSRQTVVVYYKQVFVTNSNYGIIYGTDWGYSDGGHADATTKITYQFAQENNDGTTTILKSGDYWYTKKSDPIQGIGAQLNPKYVISKITVDDIEQDLNQEVSLDRQQDHVVTFYIKSVETTKVQYNWIGAENLNVELPTDDTEYNWDEKAPLTEEAKAFTPNLIQTDADGVKYMFSGWYNNPNFEGNPVEELTVSENSYTFYGRWISNVIEIDLNKDEDGTARFQKTLASADKLADNDAREFTISITNDADSDETYTGTATVSKNDSTAPFVFDDSQKLVFDITDAIENGTPAEDGIDYSYTVAETPSSDDIVSDTSTYTMTVNVKLDGQNLVATVSFTNATEEAVTTPITFTNTYTPSYPVYVYGRYMHNGNHLEGDVTVNNEKVQWNADSTNPNDKDKEYYITFGKIEKGTKVEATEGAPSPELLFNTNNITLDEKFTGTGSAASNNVSLNNVNSWGNVHACPGAVGYTNDGFAWHMDGDINVYTVAYDANAGGDTVTNMPDNPSGYFFDNYTTAAAPSREGYDFQGWQVKGTDNVYEANQKFTLNGDVTLVAQWTLSNANVTFMIDGGKWTTAPEAVKDTANAFKETIKLDNGHATLANIGYIPTGEADGSHTGNGKWYKDNNPIIGEFRDQSVEDGNVFTLKFDPKAPPKTATVTFEINGGTWNPTAPESIVLDVENSPAKLSDKLSAAPEGTANENYSPEGKWYKKVNDDLAPVDNILNVSIDSDTTFVLKFDKQQYTIEYQWSTDHPSDIPNDQLPQATTKDGLAPTDEAEINALNEAATKTYTTTSTANNGKYGEWTLVGWTPLRSDDGTKIIFTGNWKFTEKEKPVEVKVTFKIEGGTWDGTNSEDQTTTVILTNGVGYLKEEQLPKGTHTPDANHIGTGYWKIDEGQDITSILIQGNTDFIYTFNERGTVAAELSKLIQKKFESQYGYSTEGTFTATAEVIAKPVATAISYTAEVGVSSDNNTNTPGTDKPKTFTGTVNLKTGDTKQPFTFSTKEAADNVLKPNMCYAVRVSEDKGNLFKVTYDTTKYILRFTTGENCEVSDIQIVKEKDSSKPETVDKITFHNIYTYKKRSHSSGDDGNGGGKKEEKPTVEIKDDDALGLNNTDHFAYIVGYGNGEVRPQNSITRAEVAAIFFRLLEDDVRDANYTRQNKFTDVSNDAWYCSAVSTLSAMGIISGYPDATFRPNASITRAEFAAIATRFDVNGDKTPASFNDIAGHWAKDEIAVAANNGWVNGYEDGSFRPQNKITRAETMSLVNRVLNRKPETAEDLLENMAKWTDNADTNAWYYLAVQEATNSHYYEYKENSQYEKWTELRETRDWSELDK